MSIGMCVGVSGGDLKLFKKKKKAQTFVNNFLLKENTKIWNRFKPMPPVRFELTTPGLRDQCSEPLSYRGKHFLQCVI